MDSLDAARLEPYRSETKRATVDITYADGTMIRGDLHLQPTTMHSEGFETVLELLNRPEPFFAATLESAEAAFISKAQIAVVTRHQTMSQTDRERLSVATEAELNVHLASGAQYRGVAMWELPPSHCRSIDYLNDAGRFFEIRSDSCTWFVNRAHVHAVYPSD